jgi:putative ABC transport system permease protein
MLKYLRRKNIGDLRANRGQFIMVWLVAMLGVTFYGAMYPAGRNMLKSFYKTYDQLHYMDFQVQFDTTDADQINSDTLRAIPGVANVESRLIVESGLKLKPDQKYQINLRLISVPDDRQPSVNRSNITDGHEIRAENELLLLKSFADYHKIEPGDTLPVWIDGVPYEFRVAGLAFNAEYLIAGRGLTSPFPTPSSFGVAWMPYSRLASISGQEGQINDVVLQLDGKGGDDKTDLEKSVRQALNTHFAEQNNLAILSRIQTASGGCVDANINGNLPIAIFFSGVFLIGSTLITGILLARLVESERQRIGTLRAMGITRRELMQHYLIFGLIIGLSAGLVGSVLGYLNSFWVMSTYIRLIAGGTIPAFVNAPQIPFILLGFVVVVLGSTFAGVYPAWVQSATPPGIALRPAAPKTPNAISRARMVFLPSILRQVIRNILRVPGRSLSTALGVVAGAMMIFSALVLWDTMDVTFKDYFNSTPFDLRVDMDTILPIETLETEIAKIEGVKAVQGALVGPATLIKTNGEKLDTIAISAAKQTSFFDLKTLEGSRAFSNVDGVWIGHNARRVLDVKTGDTLTLRVLGQDHPVKVLGVVSYALGSPVFVPQELAEQWSGFSVANMALIRVKDGQAEAVRDALVDLPGMRGVEMLPEFETDVNRYMAFFRVGTLIFGGFGYILTLAVLFNTVNGSLRERRDELAILRALGSRRREIAVMVTLEMLLMVFFGLLIGIPIGREMGFYLNHTYDTDFFGQVNAVKPISYLIGLISMVLIVLVAEIPGLRAVQRVDLGTVSKSQSF